ncbi:hypothetical protein VTI28DRAFT_2140 [Corynascus sepedonium]
MAIFTWLATQYSGPQKCRDTLTVRRDACTFQNTPYFSMEPHTPNRPKIFALKEAGWSYRRIAAHEGISPGTAHGIVKRYCEQKSAKSLPRSGRPRYLTERDIRYLRRLIDQNPFISCRELKEQAGLSCSIDTIRRRLVEAGIQHPQALQRPKCNHGECDREACLCKSS